MKENKSVFETNGNLLRAAALRLACAACLTMTSAGAAEPDIAIGAKQRYPWNGLVDVDFTLDAEAGMEYSVSLSARDAATGSALALETLRDDDGNPVSPSGALAAPGTHHWIWDADADLPDGFDTASAVLSADVGTPQYAVIDLSGGPNAERFPVAFLSSEPEGGFNTDEYKTSKLVLRRIPAGVFAMGSPTNELGRAEREALHEATLRKALYVGIFEVTQKQWELAMGINPSKHPGDTRPVEQVSHAAIRGGTAGAAWPAESGVDADSFLGVLRAKTGLPFDLPTEAQWEYACRAGTTTALNNGKALTGIDECPNLAEVGRYKGNAGDGAGGFSEHTAVGSYTPNGWGLYDMHGNVWEWCLDWYSETGETAAALDPSGPTGGVYRVQRGGSWSRTAQNCRSAMRGGYFPAFASDDYGFRICLEDTDGYGMFTVQFDANGGTGAMADIHRAYGTPFALPANAFSLPAHVFTGWAETVGGPVAFPDGATISNLTPVAGATVTLHAVWEEPLYAVVDLSGGPSAASYPVRYLAAPPEGGFDADEYKTTKLVLRRLLPGTFAMGSPDGETGRASGETRHDVTLTEGFYIGLHEVTQKQWELVTGQNPAQFLGASRPVDQVSHAMVRGTSAGAGWPGSLAVDAGSFLGKLRAKTGGLAFDLPTEAQWEYSCRAGTETSLNSGTNLLGADACPYLSELAKYRFNSGASGTSDGRGGYDYAYASAGSYLPNAWGLHDMHGNVLEWCLDWWSADPGASAATNPAGPAAGSARVLRGGDWTRPAADCRSASRDSADPALPGDPSDEEEGYGLRLVLREENNFGLRVHTIRYDANGGTGTMADQGLVNGMALRPNAFQSPGCIFAGWAASATGEVVRVDREIVTDLPSTHSVTQTLYARWMPLYMVVDISGGASAASWPVSYLYDAPSGGWTDGYKTTKLLFRAVESGTFRMGSPESELGRATGETPHSVTVSCPYYMGVFEVTQKQWELATGQNPAYSKGDTRPVERVSYDDIRGTSDGAAWPALDAVDSGSFLGILRAKTGLLLDLPTEAQWEYACRAGTATALNSGKNLTATNECPNLAALGRYKGNTADGKGGSTNRHAAVGAYLPNAWGLYDMHGNIGEWCRDWFEEDPGDAPSIDPVGSATGTARVVRGGSWNVYAEHCRSASRAGYAPANNHTIYGLRLCSPIVLRSNLNRYTVHFDANGGTGTMADQEFVQGVAQALRQNGFYKANYGFMGWATTTNGAVVYANGEKVTSVTTTPNGSVTLYAVWSPIQYTVRFNANGGSGTMADQGFAYDTAQALRANAFSRRGYQFMGWATSAGGSRTYSDGQSVMNLTTTPNGTVTLYAVWELYPYMVIEFPWASSSASSYSVTFLSNPPSGGFNTDTYKSSKLVLRRIDPGSFWMCGEYLTTLTKPYYIGIFEVTQDQYYKVVGSNPSYHDLADSKSPVEWVSYATIRGNTNSLSAVSADSFMGRLRARTGLTFDLPTEAQWEYACRAGTTTDHHFSNSYAWSQYMWCKDNLTSIPQVVGTKLPNAWGLYDMYGNVSEWCLDGYWYPLTSGRTDPVTSISDGTAIIRGGSCDDDVSTCSSSYRKSARLYEKNPRIGFRLAATPP